MEPVDSYNTSAAKEIAAAGGLSRGAAPSSSPGESVSSETSAEKISEPAKKQKKPKEKPKPKPRVSQSTCVAITGGIVIYGTKELAALGLHFLRGASVAEVFFAGVAGQGASRVILGVAATAAVIYVVDEATDKAISKATAEMLGCPK